MVKSGFFCMHQVSYREYSAINWQKFKYIKGAPMKKQNKQRKNIASLSFNIIYDTEAVILV